MNYYLESLPIGNDPRIFNQFLSIKEELDKRFHPARPDINWQHIHELCISLFNQNGIDLQTASWFTLCNQQISGLEGLSEGLSLIHKVITQNWQNIWPVQTHTRINILSSLSQQLVSGIRGTTFLYKDLALLYRIEEQLKNINNQLQSLEIKHLVRFDYLQNLIVTQIQQLEKPDTLDNNFCSPDLSPVLTQSIELSNKTKKNKINNLSTKNYISSSISSQSSNIKENEKQTLWRGILIGTIVSSLLFISLFYFWLSGLKDNSNIGEFSYISSIEMQKIPSVDPNMINRKNSHSMLTKEQLNTIQQRLDTLVQLSPSWAQTHGIEVINYLNKQYNSNSGLLLLTKKWKENLEINAITDKQLNEWANGMAQLDELSQRLDRFDGDPKKYITGSELKSIIFKTKQHFNQAKPLEEELRLLEKKSIENTISDYDYQQVDYHFKQLLNRYSLLKSQSK
ncbi:TPA: type VI secretion system ImpA family N-terminal domain-containing protein [Proteus mirabilis]|nr:type VI secretion system ImpA family N-terminal domain-containing protein [Proteus mirabilis]HEK2020551.1 type VI secretion system ImpA family N-terminal domain-containing protein [Proteus mirabilis]HEK2099545.1 type VI secretion system ImpA family N-terminal domain-containing protein [Proteus mirabilis]